MALDGRKTCCFALSRVLLDNAYVKSYWIQDG